MANVRQVSGSGCVEVDCPHCGYGQVFYYATTGIEVFYRCKECGEAFVVSGKAVMDCKVRKVIIEEGEL